MQPTPAGPMAIPAASTCIGFLLSVMLTAIPFWLVMSGRWPIRTRPRRSSPGAIVQIVVHTCVLPARQHALGRRLDAARLPVFTAVIVVLIVIGGSLWIMYHLNTNMMPMPGAGMEPRS
jgi:cytochrome o ubiquinol oxidase operon protein cyoD